MEGDGRCKLGETARREGEPGHGVVLWGECKPSMIPARALGRYGLVGEGGFCAMVEVYLLGVGGWLCFPPEIDQPTSDSN